MAVAAGVKACMLGYKTKFYTVTELVLKLAEARKNGTLERLLKDLRALDLPILDEWGMSLWIKMAPDCCSGSYPIVMKAKA